MCGFVKLEKISFAVAVFWSLWGSPAIAQDCRVLDFEDLELDTELNNGDTFQSGGVTIQAETFFLSDVICKTRPFPGGFARVSNERLACRNGNELTVDNVNLSFDFGRRPMGGVSCQVQRMKPCGCGTWRQDGWNTHSRGTRGKCVL